MCSLYGCVVHQKWKILNFSILICNRQTKTKNRSKELKKKNKTNKQQQKLHQYENEEKLT